MTGRPWSDGWPGGSGAQERPQYARHNLGRNWDGNGDSIAQRWTEFLKTHWDVLAAADFFTIDVWTGRGLTRFVMLFIIELSTRRVEIADITAVPDASWMSQVSRNVTDVSDAFLTGKTLPDPRSGYAVHGRLRRDTGQRGC